jgi:3'-phosphoadenosine 5'-phosphosulfate synthase
MATTAHLLTPPRLHHPGNLSSSPAASLCAPASLAHPLLSPRLRRTATPTSPPPRRRAMPVRSSLIDPDGGALVDLVAAPDRRAALRAEADRLPRVRMTPIDLQWAHVLAEGWASPLRGFMREDEYLQALHFNCIRLPDGVARVNMSLPIVLAIGDDDKDQIGDKPDVALQMPDGGVVAILRRSVRLIYLAFPYFFRFLCVFYDKKIAAILVLLCSIRYNVCCNFHAENGIFYVDIRGM